MQKHIRLSRSKDFAAVRQNGNIWSEKNVVMLVSSRVDDNLHLPSRFGLVVSKRVGNAVVRNKCKRRMRECVRRLIVHHGHDVVFIAREGLPGESYASMLHTMGQLLHRAGVETSQDFT